MARMPDFEMPDEPVVEELAPAARAHEAPSAGAVALDEPTAPDATLRHRAVALAGRIRVPALAFLLGVAVAAVGVTWVGSAQDDAARADELFSILMGEDVESRRSFITRNAKDVRFLDI